MPIDWEIRGEISVRHYRCGYCGNSVASNRGLRGQESPSPSMHPQEAFVAICTSCTSPTFLMGRRQVPGARFGADVTGIDDQIVVDLYAEARECMGISAHTAVVLSCRKILMHIAVALGADEGKSFVEYVAYLDTEHHIPPRGRDWVDVIRKAGNTANHEIVIASKETATDVLTFVEMLLRFVYEMPARVRTRNEAEE